MITHFPTTPFVKKGTATTTAARVDVTWQGNALSRAEHIDIRNTGSAEKLLVSFDGTDYFTVDPGDAYDKWGRFSEIFVKTSAATTTYETTVSPAP